MHIDSKRLADILIANDGNLASIGMSPVPLMASDIASAISAIVPVNPVGESADTDTYYNALQAIGYISDLYIKIKTGGADEKEATAILEKLKNLKKEDLPKEISDIVQGIIDLKASSKDWASFKTSFTQVYSTNLTKINKWMTDNSTALSDYLKKLDLSQPDSLHFMLNILMYIIAGDIELPDKFDRFFNPSGTSFVCCILSLCYASGSTEISAVKSRIQKFIDLLTTLPHGTTYLSKIISRLQEDVKKPDDDPSWTELPDAYMTELKNLQRVLKNFFEG